MKDHMINLVNTNGYEDHLEHYERAALQRMRAETHTPDDVDEVVDAVTRLEMRFEKGSS